jgi:hypothetical protein
MRKKKNERAKFYVEMDGRWAQLSHSDKEVCDLVKKVVPVRPLQGRTAIHVIHIN